MSIPPQLIRVKRKRVEEAPVTFLHFDGQSQKRHRGGSNWAYQRRKSAPLPSPEAAVHNGKPVIHVSRPPNASPSISSGPRVQSPARSVVSATLPRTGPSEPSTLVEPRRFHVSRSTLSAGKSQTLNAGISKKARYSPAIFVERGRRKQMTDSRESLAALQSATQAETEPPPNPIDAVRTDADEQKQLKRPGVVSKKNPSSHKDAPTHAPLPASLTNRHNQDMDKITADMNQWVLDEIGANLCRFEQEKQKAEKINFRPKAPAQRYQSRHPGQVSTRGPVDVAMSDVSGDDDDDDDDEWIIEEYVRIPANSVALDVLPSDIGVLVLDDDEESMLFFGPAQDEDDDLDEDDEDENAEDHYTADYPEDEVESDDEYGRHPYGYRNGTASDDEEFDNVCYSEEADNDELALAGGATVNDDDDDDDARMARIRTYMKRNSAFG